MQKKIINELLQILANAPTVAAQNYLQTLTEQDKKECLRLLQALKIKIE